MFSENHTRHICTLCGQIGEFLRIIIVTTYSNNYALQGQSQHTVGGTTLKSGKITQYECVTYLSVNLTLCVPCIILQCLNDQ